MTDRETYRPRRAVLPDDVDWDDDPQDDDPQDDLDGADEPYVPALSFAGHRVEPADPAVEPARPAGEPVAGAPVAPVDEPVVETTEEPRPVSRRPRVVAAGLAALLVVVIAIAYTAAGLAGTGVALVPTGPSTAPSASVTPTPRPAVSELGLLDPIQAKGIDAKAAWSTARTQTGRDADSPVAVCLQPPGAEGLPAPQLTMLRTLTAPGPRGLGVLHEADAYADRNQAIQVFKKYAQQLGGCTVDGAYLVGSTVVESLGNEAVTVTVAVATGAAKPTYHTVLLVRTGRVLNIADAYAGDTPVTAAAIATAFGPAINRQCVDADGLCAQKPSVTEVVPPIGAEVPGLPALADVPRLPTMTGHWSTTPPVRNGQLPDGSQCERLGGTKVKPRTTLGRAYLVQDDDKVPATYGWDLVLFSFADPGSASAYATEVRASIDKCADRQKTAKVTGAATFTGTGTQRTPITAHTWNVRQPTGVNANQFADYRVGLAVAGNKVVYLFLPLDGRNNFTDAQWKGLVLRSAQRATQVS